jgi:hypothetical protein
VSPDKTATRQEKTAQSLQTATIASFSQRRCQHGRSFPERRTDTTASTGIIGVKLGKD